MAEEFKEKIDLDIRDSTPDWDAFLPEKAPEGAPNVVVFLYDDTGLAAWSPFGGRIEMPTLERLTHRLRRRRLVSGEYRPKFEFTGGRIVKVVYDVADDAYVDVERALAAAIAAD